MRANACLFHSVCSVAQSYLTLWDPMDCSLAGSSVYGIFQERILECISISNCRVSSRPRNQTRVSCVSCIGRQSCFFFFNFILFLNFTILYWFCQISKWIHHRYTRVPHPKPSSLLPPHTIPLGRPSAPTPSIQYRASNLDWRLVSYMILYIFQCHSPKSSHPLPLPLCF